ncbi:hypothetical protein D3Z50_19930 [Clostridiaceae bacterium]|nr:hypothetical protein [Clostridiaceae bacterium]
MPEAAQENVREKGKRFSKEQLLASERFRERRDIVDALLDNGRQYTVKDVEEAIGRYMKGRVK